MLACICALRIPVLAGRHVLALADWHAPGWLMICFTPATSNLGKGVGEDWEICRQRDVALIGASY